MQLPWRWEEANQLFISVLESLNHVTDADRRQHHELVALQARYEAIANTTTISAIPDQQSLDRQSQAAAWFNVGIILLIRGNVEGAARAFEQAQVIDPDRGDYRTATTVIENVQRLQNQTKPATPSKGNP